MTNESLTLENLGGGVAAEQFNAELSRVLENILDPNTKATNAREIILKVKFKPDEDRELADIEVQCHSKLCPVKPFPTQIYIGTHKGQPVATEYNPKQMHIKDVAAPESPENVVPFDRKEESK